MAENNKKDKDMSSKTGKAFEELSAEQMAVLQGAGDVDGETFVVSVAIGGAASIIATTLYKTLK